MFRTRWVDRREVLYGVAGIAVAAAAPARARPVQPQPLSFLAFGDWGRGGRRSQTEVAGAMALAAADAGSRFVLSVGDNFYPAGVQSVDDSHWRESFEDIYTAPALQTPWYAALGNHDYRGVPSAQVAYGRHNRRWRMPSRYYVIDGDNLARPDLEIFVLDTTPLTGDSAETLVRLSRGRVSMPDPDHQLAWLKARLERSNAPWKVVVGHHPIRSGGRHGGSPALVAQVEPLLEAHGVQAYLNGHDHALQHIRVGRTHHICTGAGSSAGDVDRVDGTLFRHGEPGFAVLTLDGETLRLEFRDAANRSLYEAAIPKTAA